MQKIFEILRNPLSKGEPDEKKNIRYIEISQSSDNKKVSPKTVYFGISREKRINSITEDFHFLPHEAIILGKALIETAKQIEKKYVKPVIKKEKKKVTVIIGTKDKKSKTPSFKLFERVMIGAKGHGRKTDIFSGVPVDYKSSKPKNQIRQTTTPSIEIPVIKRAKRVVTTYIGGKKQKTK
jgi:hypothetical protein